MATLHAKRGALRALGLTMTTLLGVAGLAVPALASTDVPGVPVYEHVGCVEVHVEHYPQHLAGGGCIGTLGVALVDHTATSCWLVTVDGIVVGTVHVINC